MRCGVLVGIAAGAMVLASVSMAVAQSADFRGRATVGSASREVVVRFACALERGRINNLAAELDIPSATELTSVFDFNRFEGPDGIGGRHHLSASGRTRSEMDFAATGSYGNNGSPDTTFTFSAAMTPDARAARNLRRLQSVVTALSAGPGRLVYTVANPAQAGPALSDSFDLSAEDAARLRAATSGCLAPR